MTDRNETATYLYCLVRQERAPVLARAPRGLPATGRARALDAGDGLWLVVADAPLSRYGSAPLETHLRDLEWVAACATAHEAVVNFPVRWAEWNGRYRDAARALWKGEGGRAAELGYRLSGSGDLYEHSGRRPSASINFITAHDGFTLRDLVSYNEKHNEANGENNNDGASDNRSWNCGEEGPTGREDVNTAFESLANVADDARRRPPDSVEGAARLVLDAVFLLPPRRLARFKKVARATATRLGRHGYELTLSGPWPPYNFAGGVA